MGTLEHKNRKSEIKISLNDSTAKWRDGGKSQ